MKPRVASLFLVLLSFCAMGSQGPPPKGHDKYISIDGVPQTKDGVTAEVEWIRVDLNRDTPVDYGPKNVPVDRGVLLGGVIRDVIPNKFDGRRSVVMEIIKQADDGRLREEKCDVVVLTPAIYPTAAHKGRRPDSPESIYFEHRHTFHEEGRWTIVVGVVENGKFWICATSTYVTKRR